MASQTRESEPAPAAEAPTSFKQIAFRILLVIGSLVLVGVFLQPDSIKALDLDDANAVKDVFFGGQPHVVLCDSSRRDAKQVIARVSQAAIVLQSGAGGKIITVSANCTQPMASGRSIVDRFKAQLQVKAKRSAKPRLPSPLAFTVANGQPPVVIPPGILKGRLPLRAEVRDTATTSADVAVLVAAVKANTGLRKINRLKSSSGLAKCIASARRCAVLLYSLPLPPTSTKNPWAHGLDGSNALKAAREAHRDVQFSVLNTTRHGIKGVSQALKQLLPGQMGHPVEGGLNAALASAPGAVLVLSPIAGGVCPPGTGAARFPSHHAQKGRHMATVHALSGEITAAAVTAAVDRAEADAAAVEDMSEEQRCSSDMLVPTSTRVLKSAVKVFGRQSEHKGSAVKAEPGKRKRAPRATPAPTPQARAQQTHEEAAAAAAAQSSREAAARAAMDDAAREFVPEFVESEEEDELLLDDEMPYDAEEEFDVEEIEL